jgi:hypothetical protein
VSLIVFQEKNFNLKIFNFSQETLIILLIGIISIKIIIDALIAVDLKIKS